MPLPSALSSTSTRAAASGFSPKAYTKNGAKSVVLFEATFPLRRQIRYRLHAHRARQCRFLFRDSNPVVANFEEHLVVPIEGETNVDYVVVHPIGGEQAFGDDATAATFLATRCDGV